MSKERILLMTAGSRKITQVSTEAVSVAAGAAGTLVSVYLERKPILDANGGFIGGNGDSSLAFSACLTVEVAKKADADLANGEYWVDYLIGKVRGRKGNTATSITANYKILV